MGYVRVALRLFRFLPLAALLLMAIPSSYAQKVDLSGRYQCAQAKMHGKVIPCNAAPLILKNDGRFELRGWEGSYLVNGEWVELSDSLIKAKARSKRKLRLNRATRSCCVTTGSMAWWK